MEDEDEEDGRIGRWGGLEGQRRQDDGRIGKMLRRGGWGDENRREGCRRGAGWEGG